MNPSSSSQRFDTLAGAYAASEVHRASPTLEHLHALLPPQVEAVCDVASGAGHTGLSFAGVASRIVAVDPAPNMLAQVRGRARRRRRDRRVLRRGDPAAHGILRPSRLPGGGAPLL